MQTEKDIKSEISTVTELSKLFTSLQEVYVGKMQKARNSILLSRDYYKGLYGLLAQVVSEPLEQVGKKKLVNNPHAGKKLAILFSGSKKFAGNVNRQVFGEFIDYIKQEHADVIVLGKLGKDLLAQNNITEGFSLFEWSESLEDMQMIRDIAQQIVGYEQVRLFFAQYENFASQIAMNIDLYKDIDRSENATTKSRVEFLYEPSKQQVVEFFQSKVMESFMYHSLQELYLALVGGRVFRMEESSNNTRRLIGVLIRMQDLSQKRKKNAAQLSNISRIINIRHEQQLLSV